MFEFGQIIQCLDTFCFIILDGLLSAYERNLIKGSWNQFKTTRQWLITRCFYYLLKTTLKCNIGPITYKCPLPLIIFTSLKWCYAYSYQPKTHPFYCLGMYHGDTEKIQICWNIFFSFDYFNRYITDFVNFTIILSVYLYVA